MEDTFINNTIDSKYFNIKNTDYDNACFYKSFSNSVLKEDIDIGNDLSKIIQNIAYEWIINNSELYYEEYNLYIRDLINISHNLSLDEYIKIYKHYAEDYVENYQERWGSLVETIALSEIFKIPIFIYTSQKYDKNRNKVIIGKISNNNKAHKGVRFKLYQQIGLKYYSNHKKPICLLWKDGKYGAHYMSLKLIDNYQLNENGIPLKN